MMKQLPVKKQWMNTKPLLAILVGICIAYTSCRKTENAPAPLPNKTQSSTVSNDTLSRQIAINLASSIAGNFGGANLMDGVDSVSLTGHNGPQHGANSNSLCGFITDSLVNYSYKSNDTTSHTTGELKFFFNCVNGQSTGYSAYDSLKTIRTTSKGTSSFYVKQTYTIKALVNNHQFIGVDGDIYYHNEVTPSCACHNGVTDVEDANYVLKDLVINTCSCSRDVLSGTATFVAHGPNWSVSGSMIYLGNHMVDVLINGVTYHVNWLTHKVTV